MCSMQMSLTAHRGLLFYQHSCFVVIYSSRNCCCRFLWTVFLHCSLLGRLFLFFAFHLSPPVSRGVASRRTENTIYLHAQIKCKVFGLQDVLYSNSSVIILHRLA